MDVLMPQLGETVVEGKIIKWFKSAGEAVKPGDELFEIETDKTSMDVPSTVSGTLTETRFRVGEVARVGAVVAVIAGHGEATAAVEGAKRPPVPGQTSAVAQSPAASDRQPQADAVSSASAPMDPFREVLTPERNYGPARLAGGIVVTPLARRLASERGIDLTRLAGSGPHGRIVACDLEQTQSAGFPAMTDLAPAEPAGPAPLKMLYADIAHEDVPIDGMRATIARRLIEAKQTVPHFYLTADLDADRLIAMRAQANSAATAGNGSHPAFKLSLNDFIIKAWAAALQRIPAANAVWAQDRILRFKSSDIGVAVALENGLITPVIRNADSKSLAAISAEMRDLAVRARARKLKPNDYQGGASAISNLGMYGVREFAAIINPPHATILAVGATRRAPVEAADGGVRFASQLTVTLSCDHRVVDGVLGAELLKAFKALIENPLMIMV